MLEHCFLIYLYVETDFKIRNFEQLNSCICVSCFFCDLLPSPPPVNLH